MLSRFIYILAYIMAFFLTYHLMFNPELAIFFCLIVIFFNLFVILKKIILHTYFSHVDNLYYQYYILLYLNKWVLVLQERYLKTLLNYYYDFDVQYFLGLVKIILFNTLIKESLTNTLLKLNNIFVFVLNRKFFYNKYIYNILSIAMFNNIKYVYLFYIKYSFLNKPLALKQGITISKSTLTRICPENSKNKIK